MTTIAASLNNKTKNQFPDLIIRDKLGNGKITLDIAKKQLLFLTNSTQTASCLVIDLNTLNRCSVTKEYDTIQAGALKRNKLCRFLKNIYLNLESGNEPVTLVVYNANQDTRADVRLLERKAKKWQSIISKFLKDKVQKKTYKRRLADCFFCVCVLTCMQSLFFIHAPHIY